MQPPAPDSNGLAAAVLDSLIVLAAVTASVSAYKIAKKYISEIYNDYSAPDHVKRKLVANGARLSFHESQLLGCILDSSTINQSWEDFGGLDNIVHEIKDDVIAPLTNRHLFAKMPSYFVPPKGLLLYGAPGCGKTMLAKIIAKESHCTFINIDISDLSSKWYGESSKLLCALFSLANKLQPSIIFVDEVESLLKSRNDQDHEATSFLKTSFMSLWDGINTNNASAILVIGATNRPETLDPAILRRFVKKIHVPLPTAKQRAAILKAILHEEESLDNLNYDEIARLTEHFSGSDLKELCRAVAMSRFMVCLKNRNRLIQVYTDKINNLLSQYPDKTSFDFISIGKPKIDDLERELKLNLGKADHLVPLSTSHFASALVKSRPGSQKNCTHQLDASTLD